MKRSAPQIWEKLHKFCYTQKSAQPKRSQSRSSPGKNKIAFTKRIAQRSFATKTGSRMCMILHDIYEKFPCACMHKYARATTQHTTRTWSSLKIRRLFRRPLPRASGVEGLDLPAVGAPVRGTSHLSLMLLSCLRKSIRTALVQSHCSSRRRQNAFVKKSRIC